MANKNKGSQVFILFLGLILSLLMTVLGAVIFVLSFCSICGLS